MFKMSYMQLSLLSSFNAGTQEWKPLTRKTCPTPNGWTSETPLCNYFVEYGGQTVFLHGVDVTSYSGLIYLIRFG